MCFVAYKLFRTISIHTYEVSRHMIMNLNRREKHSIKKIRWIVKNG